MSKPTLSSRSRRNPWLLASLCALTFSLACSQGPRSQNQREDYGESARRLIEAARSSSDAYETLGLLCDRFGHRLSGTPQLEAAIDWLASRMHDSGLENVRKQEVMVPVWVRGRESATLLLPRPVPLTILGLGNSVGTRSGGITADVTVVGSFEELDALPDEATLGKIVLFDVPYQGYGETVRYRSSGASAAARRGAVACLVRSIGPRGHQTPHTGALRYDDDAPRIPAAAVTVEDALMMRRTAERGERIVARLEMEARFAEDALSHNLIGEVVGREVPDEIVVIGGHIDSWDVGQGAQDDGAGCIIALEAAHLIQKLGLAPRRTIRVVLFTNEENGLRGGRAYRDAHRDELEKHVAAIESDTGNALSDGFRLDIRNAAVGNPTGPEVEERLAGLREEALAKLSRIGALLEPLGAANMRLSYSGADIGPLCEEGVPGLGMNHDTEPYFMIHHTNADTFDRIVLEDLQTNVAVMAIMAFVLADMPGRLVEPAGPTPTH